MSPSAAVASSEAAIPSASSVSVLAKTKPRSNSRQIQEPRDPAHRRAHVAVVDRDRDLGEEIQQVHDRHRAGDRGGERGDARRLPRRAWRSDADERAQGGGEHGDVGDKQRPAQPREAAEQALRTGGGALERKAVGAPDGRSPQRRLLHRTGLALGVDQHGDGPAFDERHQQRSAEQDQQHRDQERPERDRMGEQRRGDGRDRRGARPGESRRSARGRGEEDQDRAAGHGHGQQRR